MSPGRDKRDRKMLAEWSGAARKERLRQAALDVEQLIAEGVDRYGPGRAMMSAQTTDAIDHLIAVAKE